HGKLGPRPDVRRQGPPPLAPRGSRMAVRSRRARDPRGPSDESARGVQSEQPHRDRDAGGPAPGDPRRRPGFESVAFGRRSLRGRGARGPADREPLGRLRADPHLERAEQSLCAAGPPDRLGRRASGPPSHAPPPPPPPPPHPHPPPPPPPPPP